MGIELKTPMSEINRYIEQQIKRAEKAIIYNLQLVGERVVNHARSLPSPSATVYKGRIPPHQPNYIDHTANLRSSIGYVISCDGNIRTNGGFKAEANGSDGAAIGSKYAKEVAGRYPEGIVLVVVAGMEYAAYVSAKGYDVIDSAELLADKLVPQILRQLGFK
ncbi:MAG: hypothetical protein ACI4AK_05900 [Lepagella sp.]